MAEFELLSKVNHKDLFFTKPENYLFAKAEATVGVGLSELQYLCKDIPLVFLKGSDNNIRLVALLALLAGTNNFISADGRWLTDYVPAAIKCYPFKLITVKSSTDAKLKKKNKLPTEPKEPKLKMLGLMKDSQCISIEPKNGSVKIFNEDGTLNPLIEAKRKLLSLIDQEAESLIQTMNLFSGLNFFNEIALSDKEGNKKVLRNLFGVKAYKLQSCSGKDLKQLTKIVKTQNNLASFSATELIYRHNFSLFNIQNLLKKNETVAISTRDKVVRDSQQRKVAEVNDLVQNLLGEA